MSLQSRNDSAMRTAESRWLDPSNEGPDPVRCPVCGESDSRYPWEPTCEDCRPDECDVCGLETFSGNLVDRMCAGDLLVMEDSSCIEYDWATWPGWKAFVDRAGIDPQIA